MSISKTPLLMAALALWISGCGPNQAIVESGRSNSTPVANVPIEKSTMEQDLEAMRTADFSVVFVIRRKDGGPLTSEDRAIVRENTNQANRRVAADEGKAIIVGSNFVIAPQNMKNLQENFVIEDHSPPVVNTNSISPQGQ